LISIVVEPRPALLLLSGRAMKVFRLLLLILATSAAAAADHAPGATFKSQVTLASVLVHAADKHGNPVFGLKPSDFRIFQGDTPKGPLEIEYFVNPASDVPIDVVFLLDNSESMYGKKIDFAKAAVSDFVGHLKVEDRGVVAPLNDSWSGFTSNIQELRGHVARISTSGDTPLWENLFAAREFLKDHSDTHQRRYQSIIVLSDGEDNWTSRHYSNHTPIDGLYGSTVSVYFIAIGKMQPETRATIDNLTHYAHGKSYYVNDAAALPRVYEDIRKRLPLRYAIAFHPIENDSWKTEISIAGHPDYRVSTIRSDNFLFSDADKIQ
jgi:hypothetical protein